MYCLGIGPLPVMVLNGFCYIVSLTECYFNSHMHKMSPWGSRHYFWQPILLAKYQKAQIPEVPLFSYWKTPKCTEFKKL